MSRKLQAMRGTHGDDDQFRRQHQRRVATEREVDGTRRPVIVNEAESPLGWLRSRKDRNGRKLIEDHQFDAGERLRARLLVCAYEPARDGELVGACAGRPRAPRGAVKSRNVAR
jgi:hypothetical protein